MIANESSWKVRDGGEKDAERILSLRRLVFGELEEDKLDPRFWKWEFLDGVDGKALLYLAEDGERLAGHFADIRFHAVEIDAQNRSVEVVFTRTNERLRHEHCP